MKNYRGLIEINECERCGYNEFKSCLHVHHIDENHNNNDSSNLIVLCANCHWGLHHNEWSIIEFLGIEKLTSITNKSMNELVSDIEYYELNENDCKSKEIILNALFSPCTSKQLFEIVKTKGYKGKYKTVTSLLVRYQKAGFIKKMNNTKPIIYGLTEFGKENARNPKLFRVKGICSNLGEFESLQELKKDNLSWYF